MAFKLSSDKEILELKSYLLRKNTDRNFTYQQLRQYYNAEYFKGTEVQGMRLIYNLMSAAVDRYTDFMIQTPEFRILPMGVSSDALDQADLLEKLLASQYQLNDFSILQGWASNLQAMLGMFAF